VETPGQAAIALAGTGSFDYVVVRFANNNFAQDDRALYQRAFPAAGIV
jgi:hypothetical protein